MQNMYQRLKDQLLFTSKQQKSCSVSDQLRQQLKPNLLPGNDFSEIQEISDQHLFTERGNTQCQKDSGKDCCKPWS